MAVQYSSALKGGGEDSDVLQGDLEDIMLSEISQAQKHRQRAVPCA